MAATLAIHRAARIVHDHLGATAGQQERMRAAEPIARAGDDGDAVVEADCHFHCSPQTPDKMCHPERSEGSFLEPKDSSLRSE